MKIHFLKKTLVYFISLIWLYQSRFFVEGLLQEYKQRSNFDERADSIERTVSTPRTTGTHAPLQLSRDNECAGAYIWVVFRISLTSLCNLDLLHSNWNQRTCNSCLGNGGLLRLLKNCHGLSVQYIDIPNVSCPICWQFHPNPHNVVGTRTELS